MCFDRDYNRILSYAKAQVEKRQLSILPEELIADTYIKFFDEHTEYKLEAFLKCVANFGMVEKFNQPNLVPFGVHWATNGKFTGDHCCLKCHEVKSASEFSIKNKYGGRSVLDTTCKKCNSECGSARVKAQRKNGTAKKYLNKNNLKNFKKYVSKKRVEWNQYLKDRFKSEKENLTDAYLRKLLRGKGYDTEFLKNTPSVIEEYREKLLQKRNRLKTENP